MNKIISALMFIVLWILSTPGIICATLFVLGIALYSKVSIKLTREECSEFIKESLYPIKQAMITTKEILTEE